MRRSSGVVAVSDKDSPAATDESPSSSGVRMMTRGGIPVVFRPASAWESTPPADPSCLRLHLEHLRLSLLRGFDQLLCLEGIIGVEQLPHQLETVRKVLRHFRGRVLLADEVGLGKTIEACLLLREYLLRGLARRVLILVPAPLVSQWHGELADKFRLDFAVPSKSASLREQVQFWGESERVLASLSCAKSSKRAELVTAQAWDLVIVDEAHHCKNRATRNWQLINALQRRHMFLLTATPVQNNLVELYNLLTLLEPGHLRTEADFKKRYIRRGNPRDPINRERLRTLLGEVMIRNTRSLVQMDLPPRYAETLVVEPGPVERGMNELLDLYLRSRCQAPVRESASVETQDDETPTSELVESATPSASQLHKAFSRMQLASLLAAYGSHPAAVRGALAAAAESDPEAAAIVKAAGEVVRSAKDERLLQLISQSPGHKLLVFVNFRRTLAHLESLLSSTNIPFSTFSGEQSDREKDAAVESFRERLPVMLCTDSGGEGRNLQFADTVVNYDLPWNPMRIEQRIGRVHRIGQTRDVFIFNLCTSGSLEARLLRLLNEKIRMFELVVGEVGSILGNLDEGDEFESLVLNLWLKARDDEELGRSFDALGDTLLDAQEKYLETKQLDEALFGEDYQ